MRNILVLLLVLSACAPKSDEPRTAASPLTPSPVSPSASPSPGRTLADLIRFTPPVNYKRRAELTWQAVEPRIGFERLDSIQTQSDATAEVRYRGGSTLNLRENTLVVIEESSGARRTGPEDRAFVGVGTVRGRTSGELWLLTSRGLVKLKGEGKARPARVTVVSRPREGVRVSLDEGRAAFIGKDKTGALAAKTLSLHEEIQIDSPVDKSGKNPDWETFAKIARAASMEPETPLSFELDEPRDQSVISAAETTLKGRVNRDGGKILVNGRQATIGDDRLFSASIALEPGANVISVQLIRPDGTTEFRRITVLRKKDGDGS